VTCEKEERKWWRGVYRYSVAGHVWESKTKLVYIQPGVKSPPQFHHVVVTVAVGSPRLMAVRH
jgi:hypothetical protein